VLVQSLERLPHRHVEEDQWIVERADRGRIALLGLEPPHEPRARVGDRVDARELGAEALHDLALERRAHARDVPLAELEADVLHPPILSTSLACGSLRAAYAPPTS